MRVLASVGILFAFTVAASAAPLCIGGTVQDYIDLGAGGCTVGDKWFKNFSFESSGHSNPSAHRVDVAVPGPGAVGLAFSSGNWHIAAINKLQTTKITYLVTPASGPTMPLWGANLLGTNVGATAFAAGAGSVILTKRLCLGAEFVGDSCAGTLVEITKEFFSDTPVFNIPATFPGQYSMVGVQDVVVLRTGEHPHYAKAWVDGYIANRYYAVPEPAGYILLGSGLIALGLLRRRFV